MSTVKLTFNTNMQSLLVQNNLKRSTNKLNQAIERLTTGAKINHASDNAANYSIVNNLDTKINAYNVAEDNAVIGLDMIQTTTSSLEIIEDGLSRLRSLQEQALNGTYGEESRNAINSECEALIDEIERTYGNAEFNNISLLQSKYSTVENFANEDTTFEQLGIGDSNFKIYDSDNVLIESYDTTAENDIGDFLEALRTHGFTANIDNGKISLESNDFYYVTGDLATALGISTATKNVITSATQSSTSPAMYTVQQLATGDSTFGQIGAVTSGTQNITVRNNDGSFAGVVGVTSDMTIDSLFERLSGFQINGSINDGIISLTSTTGNYVESGGLVSKLGISTRIDSTTTAGKTQTSTLPIIKTETITSPERTETTSVETTTTIWTTTTTSTTETETIYTTTTIPSTETLTVGTSQTSTEAITYTTVVPLTLQMEIDLLQSNVELVQQNISAGGLVSLVEHKTQEESSGYTWVTTARQLKTALSNNKKIRLGADIDMSSVNASWVMVENYDKEFDGNGYTISNFTISSSDTNVGLIASTATGAVLKNIRLENVSVKSTSTICNVGSLVGSLSAGSTVDNIAALSGKVVAGNSSSKQYSGGIIGRLGGGSITNCYNSTEVFGGYSGGIVGAGSSIENCYNFGDINSSYSFGAAGGIAGTGGGINCYNAGYIQGLTAGGILGKGSARKCYNSGDVRGSLYGGGISGESSGDRYCYNQGSISGQTTGGIAGKTVGSIRYCYNVGYITGASTGYAGGIVGALWASDISIYSCYNSGSVTGTAQGYSTCSVAGIIGGSVYVTNVTIEDCINSSANIMQDSIAGHGIVCDPNVTVTNSYYNDSLNGRYGGTATTQSDAKNRIKTGLKQQMDSETTTKTITATGTTKLSLLGLTSTSTITYQDTEGEHSQTFAKSARISAITTWLEEAGFTVSLLDGLLTITGGDNLYITSFDSNLATAFNFAGAWSAIDERDNSQTITTSVTGTSTIWETTTTSTTSTETIYTTTTIAGTTTTNTISMTTSNTFGDFGLGAESYITIRVGDTEKVVTVKTTDTAAIFISALGGANSITASLTDGKFTIAPQTGAYIVGMSNNLKNFLNINNDYYTKSYNYSNTNSSIQNQRITKTIEGTTSLADAGVGVGDIKIHKDDGTTTTISTAGLSTFNDLITLLHNNGIDMTITNGNVTSKANGNTYISSGNIMSVLKLDRAVYDYIQKNANKITGRQSYYERIENERPAPEEIVLQVGIYGDENSQIRVKLGLEWEALNSLKRIGHDLETDFLSRIDELLGIVQTKQAEFGAVQNRLESVVDQIGVMRDNLVSTRSTLRDADVAEVSSQYIRQQILQQAAATLLSTANQTPQIALGLI